MTAISRRARALLISPALLLALTLVACTVHGQSRQSGTLKHPMIDSQMTKCKAFEGLDPKCPEEIRKRQRLVTAKYYSNDGEAHQVQLVLDSELAGDVKKFFALALKERFPIHLVIPISDPRFRKDGRWDDELSMEVNKTSAFNYREVTGGARLSNHAYGRAVDINTFLNTYVKGDLVLPHGATYDPRVAGTFTADSPVVREFQRLGWTWGGMWASPRDYQHFEKPLKK